jgi:LysR family glycine cleavage system transcriptional activator
MPSLDLVKGFVAVGRRMSITQAADDLCVTQSAMSKQVRALEEAMGVRLLERGYRSVSFTEEGLRLFRSANASLQQLQDVFAQLTAAGKRPVTVTTSTGVAGLWLLPRLGEFQQRHPDVDVRVAATNAIVDLAANDIDLAIRYCTDRQAPRDAVKLFGDTVAPVASPTLRIRGPLTEQVLRRQVLLEFDDARRPWLQWSDWLSARGLVVTQARGVLRFNHYEQMIQACVAGQGLALGRLELIGPMLRDARLALLQRDAVPGADSGYGCWLLRADASPRAEVQQLADWILREAQAA